MKTISPHGRVYGARFVKEEKEVTEEQAQLIEMAGGEGHIGFRIRYEKRTEASAAQQRKVWARLVSAATPTRRIP